MFEFLKTSTFNTVFSVLLGIGVIALCKPMCKGAACRIQKAPPYEEVNAATYQLGPDCYQFRASIIECPTEGVIEPFERFAR